MRPLKVKKRIKILVISLIILGFNIKMIIPILIEDIKIKTEQKNIDVYIEGYSKKIQGKPRDSDSISKIQEKYIGVLEIPSIDLRRGLVSPYSKDNNVNKNIEFIKPYHLPNEEKKVMILASHSGTSKVSYFNKLNYVSHHDLVNIYYNNQKYKYQVIDKYKIEKTGHFTMENDNKKTLLVLITCDPNNQKKQIVVICERIT